MKRRAKHLPQLNSPSANSYVVYTSLKHTLIGNCRARSSLRSASLTFDVYRSAVSNAGVGHRLSPFG